VGLPEDLHGKSILDIGESDGLVSFEAEKREASEIVCSDIYKDKHDCKTRASLSEGILFLRIILVQKYSYTGKGFITSPR